MREARVCKIATASDCCVEADKGSKRCRVGLPFYIQCPIQFSAGHDATRARKVVPTWSGPPVSPTRAVNGPRASLNGSAILVGPNAFVIGT